MADYYNISQLIEICPGSPAQMSLSESGSPWANIPTAPSAGCVHLTRKKIWLLLSRVCYLQHRYFYCNMDCCALQRGGLLSAKSDSWHTPCAGDLADAAAAQLVILLASHVHVCRQQMVGDVVLHGQVEQQLGHAVCEHAQHKQRSFSVTTEVTFKPLSDDEISYYIHQYQPFDKAGAYGIQEWIGYIGCTGLKGSYFNVMGLPVQRIYEELRRI